MANERPSQSTTQHFEITGPRLSVRASLIVITFGLALWLLLPIVWARTDPFATPTTYRTPFDLSEDYWQYAEFAQQASDRKQVLMIGDSVIWGEYVLPDRSLAGHLNRAQDTLRFANGGVNGLHPLAMRGLVTHFGQPLRGQPVLLHCNLLWLSSAERDLSSSKELPFNHEALVPQFDPWIPCYKATISDRLGNLVLQRASLRQLVRHLRFIYFSGQDYQTWSLQRARLRRDGGRLPPRIVASRFPRQTLRHDPIPWTQRGIASQSYPWVKLDDSLQWQAFRRTLQELRDHDCDVFVVIGPFNAHLLKDQSRERWTQLREAVSSWLAQHEVSHAAPPVLPTELYGDASHPLDPGYRLLADQLLADRAFQDWLDRNSKRR